MQKETIIQFKVVMQFSQQYPEHKGLLFSVNNDTFNVKDAQNRKAMGLIKGVSDLILIIPKLGKVAGIELKAPGSRHNKNHIKNQMAWGDKIIENKGFYLMTSSIEIAIEYLSALINGYFDRAQKIQFLQRENITDQFDMQTIKF